MIGQSGLLVHTGEDCAGRTLWPLRGLITTAQAIRIVTHLERHYAEFDGFET